MSAGKKSRKKSEKSAKSRPRQASAKPAARKEAKKPAKPAPKPKPAKAPVVKKAVPRKRAEVKPVPEKPSARKAAADAAELAEAAERQKAASRRRVRRPPKPEPTFSDDLRPSPLAPPRTGLGTKYACFKCGKKFYDLNKPDPVCPRCKADQRDAPRQPVRPRAAVVAPAEPPEVDAEAERAKRRPRLLDEDEEEVLIDDDEALDLGLGVVDEPEEFEEEDEPVEEPE